MIIVFFIFVILLSLDGVLAYCSIRLARDVAKRIVNSEKIEDLLNMEPQEELRFLRRQRERVQFPRPVMVRGGFTGRGSPFLTRDQYSVIEEVDKSIERIIKR